MIHVCPAGREFGSSMHYTWRDCVFNEDQSRARYRFCQQIRPLLYAVFAEGGHPDMDTLRWIRDDS